MIDPPHSFLFFPLLLIQEEQVVSYWGKNGPDMISAVYLGCKATLNQTHKQTKDQAGTVQNSYRARIMAFDSL